MKATIIVSLKPGVLDPAGRAVVSGLHSLGYDGVSDVRIGKRFELTVADGTTEAELQRMCEQLLANPVIESWTVVTEGA